MQRCILLSCRRSGQPAARRNFKAIFGTNIKLRSWETGRESPPPKRWNLLRRAVAASRPENSRLSIAFAREWQREWHAVPPPDALPDRRSSLVRQLRGYDDRRSLEMRGDACLSPSRGRPGLSGSTEEARSALRVCREMRRGNRRAVSDCCKLIFSRSS